MRARRWRKPLSRREAQAIAQAGGRWCFVRRQIRNQGAGWENCILRVRSIGAIELLGAHPTSWRKALQAAGIFEPEDFGGAS